MSGTDKARKGLHIRWRWLSGTASGEYQLVDGRKVVGRYDLVSQAQDAMGKVRSLLAAEQGVGNE